MNLYVDEDSVHHALIGLLRRDGYGAQRPAEVGLSGRPDPVQLGRAIVTGQVLLTQNHDHFKALHDLILIAGGHHPGILVIRRDNDPTRDMTRRGIVRAIGKLLASGMPLADGFHILNHWR